MATLFETITKDIGEAMKQKNVASLSALRMLKAAMMNKEVEKGRALDDPDRRLFPALVASVNGIAHGLQGTG